MTAGLRRLVVGVDGSRPAARALAWAGDLAAALDGEVVAVHVLGLLPQHPPGGVAGAAPGGVAGAAPGGAGGTFDGRGWPTEAQRRAAAEAALHGWCEVLRRDGVRHRTMVVDGSPAPALLTVASAAGADAIVVGPRGGRTGLALGSTSHELVTGAPVPVVVVPGD